MENQKTITIQNIQKSSYKLIIPAKVESMIRLLCSEIKDTEWSGVLFYTYTGSFETDDLVIQCEDICVMDIGTSAYTEFVESPAIINYQVDHNLLDCKAGLIHSHNHMNTFFSSTDTDTLKQEGTSMNNFVSLIVNNAGNYTAAITRLISSIDDVRSSKSYKFFDKGEIDLGSSKYSEEKQELQCFFLEIQKEVSTYNEILQSLEQIKKSKTKYRVPTTSQYNIGNTNILKKESPKKEPIQTKLWEEDYKLPYDNIQIDPTVIETATLQIITGSIVITTKNKVTLESWINNMERIFNRRFPNFKDYEYWVEAHIDSVLNTTPISSDPKDIDTEISVLAFNISQLLSPYNNKYIKVIQDYLDSYIL